MTNHSLYLTGLRAATTYTLNVHSEDWNYKRGSVTGKTFSTLAASDCSSYGSGWHSISSDGNCFNAENTSYYTTSGILYSCASTPTTGCATSTGGTTGTGTSTACDGALQTLLGTGCHWMYYDSAGQGIFCDTSMTKSAKRGDAVTTTGCTGGGTTTTTTTGTSGQTNHTWRFKDGSVQYSSILSRTDAEYAALIRSMDDAAANGYFGGWKPGAGNSANWQEFGIPVVSQTATTQTTTTTGTGTSTGCDSVLIALLGSGCHWMYYDSAGQAIYCDNSMTKSAKRGDSVTMTGCTTGGTTATSTTSGALNAPTALTATVSTSGTGVTLQWTDNSVGEDEYKIWRKVPGGSWTFLISVAPVAGGFGTYYHSSGVSGSEYYVNACSTSKGCSSDSNFAIAGGTATTGTDCQSKYGTGWHTMYSDGTCYDSEMKNYRTANGTFYSCITTPASGCSGTGGGTATTTPGAPYLTSLSPSSGPIGTAVTIYGSGFALTGTNRVNFDTGVIMNVASTDGIRLSFTVPEDRVPLCAVTEPRCLLPAPYNPVRTGSYTVSVTTPAGAASNYLSFNVGERSVASNCPSGYHQMGDYYSYSSSGSPSGGYCMSDTNSTVCQPLGGGATYTCTYGRTSTTTTEIPFTVEQTRTYPRTGDSGVDPGTRIQVNFTKEIDPSSTVSQFFKLAKTSTPDASVAGNFRMFSQSFDFVPSASLESNTSYTYTVYSTLRERGGKNLSSSYTATFTTSASTAARTGTLSGKVTDQTGAGVARVHVYASTPDYTFWRDTSTDASGAFTLSLPAGTYLVEVSQPAARTDLVRTAPQKVSIATGETKTITLSFSGVPKIVTGTVLFTNGNPVADAEVGGYSSETGQWVGGTVDASGKFTLRVSGGRWILGIHPREEFKAKWSWSGPPQEAVFTKDATPESKTVNFTVAVADALLRVRVVDSSGAPVSGAGVVVDAIGSSQLIFAPREGRAPPEFKTSDASGLATFELKPGTYYMRAFLPPDRNLFNPEEQKVTVVSGRTEEATLIFRRRESFTSVPLTGVTKLENGVPIDAFIWAWSEKGGFLTSNASADGTFSLKASPGTRWHIGAGKEYQGYPYKSPELTVDVSTQPVSLDVVLVRFRDVPLPATVSVNQTATQQTVAQTTDGAKVTLPPSSATTEGTVRVEVKPTIEAPTQAATQVVGTVYDVTVRDAKGTELTQLKEDAEIILPYSEAELKALGVTEDTIVPSYFDEKTGTWVNIENYTIDKDKNVIITHVGHLTRFGIVAAADTTPPSAPSAQAAKALGEGKAKVTWKNPASDFKNAKVYRSNAVGELGQVVAATIVGTELTDTGLTNGMTYYYAVRAVDPAGNESTNSQQVSLVAVGTSAPSAVSAATPARVAGAKVLRSLKQGMRGNDVKTLQQVLISEGFLPADSATGFFGALTRAAVIRFQEKYASEVLTPAGLTKGSGFVGPGTLKKLNALVGK